MYQQTIHECAVCQRPINDGSERVWTRQHDAPKGEFRQEAIHWREYVELKISQEMLFVAFGVNVLACNIPHIEEQRLPLPVTLVVAAHMTALSTCFMECTPQATSSCQFLAHPAIFAMQVLMCAVPRRQPVRVVLGQV